MAFKSLKQFNSSFTKSLLLMICKDVGVDSEKKQFFVDNCPIVFEPLAEAKTRLTDFFLLVDKNGDLSFTGRGLGDTYYKLPYNFSQISKIESKDFFNMEGHINLVIDEVLCISYRITSSLGLALNISFVNHEGEVLPEEAIKTMDILDKAGCDWKIGNSYEFIFNKM